MREMLNGNAVMIECAGQFYETDGVLATLVQLLSDGYFRTVKGFCTLIEKEWVYHGHAFTRDNEGTLFLFMFYAVWVLMVRLLLLLLLHC